MPPESVDPHLMDDAWGSVWLHGKWTWLSKNMTTPQREVVADCITRWDARLCADDPSLDVTSQAHLRWWRYTGQLVNGVPISIHELGRPCLCVAGQTDITVDEVAALGLKCYRCTRCTKRYFEAA